MLEYACGIIKSSIGEKSMSKFMKSIICIIGICVLLLGGCSNNTSENRGQTIRKEGEVASTDKIENKIEETTSNKDIYLEKLNHLEDSLNKSLKDKYDSGITLQMLEAASEEFEEWDYMLNEIYSKLKEQLTEEEMNKLTQEELKWIETRDEKSKAADDGFEDGSIAPVLRLMSLVSSTKERCYELVNQYMK